MGTAMVQLLRFLLRHVVQRGSLTIICPNGQAVTAGDGSGTPVMARIATRSALLGLLFDPELRLGEAYMDGTITLESGSIADLLAILQGASESTSTHWRPHQALRFVMRRLQQLNRRARSQRNVAHHYDLDGRLYSLFLDSDRQYSCGYFESPRDSLDDAQLAKKRHLAAKLILRPGLRVLDIGCGWGGLALYLADFARAAVTGVTLSKEQLALARGRAVERHLENQVAFRLQDYRDIAEQFDRIVSVGMFEHVGVGYYDAFFQKCESLLADDGVMMLHSIGRSEGPGSTNPWIAKYIFPGGYVPALSEVLPAIERAGLLVNDIEILRLHYAETLKAWRERFLAHREEVERIYDSRFVRMWEFYLAGSEMAFREQALMVFQIQLTKRQGIVPMTRNYIAAEEARLRQIESAAPFPFRLTGE
jgi:cyclopropane-fatty-acyl-phospholipid synthase